MTHPSQAATERSPRPPANGFRTYSIIWGGQFVSLAGTGLANFALVVYIYRDAGAVTILVLFAIMLTQNAMSRTSSPFSGQTWLAALISIALAVGLIFTVGASEMALGNPNSSANMVHAINGGGSVARIGQLLYSPFNYSYVLPFEIASVVLLAAIIGAIVIGRED